jgi:starch synthase
VTPETGFLFTDYTPEALTAVVQEARAAWADSKTWKKRAVAAMKQDFSWDRSARQYRELYEAL